MQKYTFSEDEVNYAKSVAALRNGNKVEHGVKSKKVDSASGEEEIHIIGVLGELACARILDTNVDQSIDPSGDDGTDLSIGPITAEVKTRRGPKKDFAMYDSTSDIEADIGILCWRTGERDIVVAGWTTKAEWLLLAKELRFGRNVRRGMSWKDMREISELKDLVANE
jgi:hypothetical protein